MPLAERSPTCPGESRSVSAPENRIETVRVVREGGVSIKRAARMGCSAQTLRKSILQADRDDGVRTDGPTTDEKAELVALRRRVRVPRRRRRSRSVPRASSPDERQTVVNC